MIDFVKDLDLRGRVQYDAPLAPYTWFRVGGAAELFFVPADAEDLALFLKNAPQSLPLHCMGLASNTLFRDGGVTGAVLKLGRGFNQITVEDAHHIRVGAGVPDMKFAKEAAKAGIGGLAFYRGIPGSIGGALRMNAGAHGGETKDQLVEVRAITRMGELVTLSNQEMGFAYRQSGVPKDMIFVDALYKGERKDPEALQQEMDEVVAYREEKQPTKERTGGSTFKNPEGHSSWKLIDEAGCRGLRVGGAHMSEKHCNFMINDQNATAYDLELLGETVRKRVYEKSGVLLHWEIKRVGEFGDTGVVEAFEG